MAWQQGIEQHLVGEGGVGLHLEPGGEGAQGTSPRLHLELADARVAVQHLALQMESSTRSKSTRVRWPTRPPPDTGWRRSRGPGADDQHAGLLERLLPPQKSKDLSTIWRL